jgi:hypothetical protein
VTDWTPDAGESVYEVIEHVQQRADSTEEQVRVLFEAYQAALNRAAEARRVLSDLKLKLMDLDLDRAQHTGDFPDQGGEDVIEHDTVREMTGEDA